jgi:flagellin-like protein
LRRIHTSERAVSELVGTLLLIAITVILMATLGLFLITNLPSGNPVKAEMEITATQENNGKGELYLISIDQVTENIKLTQIKLDLSMKNYPLPVIIGFGKTQTIFQKPLILQVINTGIYNINNITMANASTGFRVFLPLGLNLTYVSIVDLETNSVIASSPVKGISVYYNPSILTSLQQCQISSDKKSSEIVYSNEAGYFEYNTTSFINSSMNKTEKNFFNLTSVHSGFIFGSLNSNSNTTNNFQLNISTFIYISNGKSLNFTFLTSEPTNVSIISNSHFYKISSQNITNSSFFITNRTFSYSGVYLVFIDYSFKYPNGLLDVMLTGSKTSS